MFDLLSNHLFLVLTVSRTPCKIFIYCEIINIVFLFRKCSGKTEEKKPQRDYSHNISVHVRQARGGPILHEEERATLKFKQFLDILKKL